MAQHQARRCAKAVLLRRQGTSDRGLHAEHRDHLCRDEHHRNRKRRRVVTHTHRAGFDVIQTDTFEARRRGLPVLRVEIIHFRCRAEIADRRAEAHQPIGRGERQGPKEYALHDAEDRRGRRDTERDRKRDGDRDDRSPPADTPGVPEVGEQTLDHGGSPRADGGRDRCTQ